MAFGKCTSELLAQMTGLVYDHSISLHVSQKESTSIKTRTTIAVTSTLRVNSHALKHLVEDIDIAFACGD